MIIKIKKTKTKKNTHQRLHRTNTEKDERYAQLDWSQVSLFHESKTNRNTFKYEHITKISTTTNPHNQQQSTQQIYQQKQHQTYHKNTTQDKHNTDKLSPH